MLTRIMLRAFPRNRLAEEDMPVVPRGRAAYDQLYRSVLKTTRHVEHCRRHIAGGITEQPQNGGRHFLGLADPAERCRSAKRDATFRPAAAGMDLGIDEAR